MFLNKKQCGKTKHSAALGRKNDDKKRNTAGAIDYISFHEFYKLYLMIDTETITQSDAQGNDIPKQGKP